MSVTRTDSEQHRDLGEPHIFRVKMKSLLYTWKINCLKFLASADILIPEKSVHSEK